MLHMTFHKAGQDANNQTIAHNHAHFSPRKEIQLLRCKVKLYLRLLKDEDDKSVAAAVRFLDPRNRTDPPQVSRDHELQ